MSKSKQRQQPISAAGESSQSTILIDESQIDNEVTRWPAADYLVNCRLYSDYN
jgi:hypothetical protein